jgi:hypothetical protein
MRWCGLRSRGSGRGFNQANIWLGKNKWQMVTVLIWSGTGLKQVAHGLKWPSGSEEYERPADEDLF